MSPGLVKALRGTRIVREASRPSSAVVAGVVNQPSPPIKPTNFPQVKTLAELDSLDDQEMKEGYMSADRGDPEPGQNRGRSFWHGWCSRMRDFGLIEDDSDHARLVKDWVEREGGRRRDLLTRTI